MVPTADNGVEPGTPCDFRLGLKAGRAQNRIGQGNPRAPLLFGDAALCYPTSRRAASAISARHNCMK
jgi:hypothetical protein